MAIKKISYDLSGKIKEIASSSVNYDDVTGKLTINKMSFSTASVGTGDGLLSTVTTGTLSASAGLNDNDIICWSTSSNKWVARGDTYDLIALNTIPIGDLTGSSYSDALVKSLSNVSSGTLQVANGGTGLSTEQVTALGTGSALLVGHGAGAMTLIKHVDVGDLSKKPVLSANADGTGWSYITQSAPAANVDVQVFNTTGSFNWYKPANTKMIRVLAQGAGGGGGSGANRNSAVAALGGAGGAAGAFVDSGLFQIDDGFLTASVVVGAGGAGAVYPVTGSSYLPPVTLMKFETLNDTITPSNTLTLTSPAVLSTDRSKFGSYSLKPTGTGGRTALVTNPTLSTDFTVEAWVYLNSTGSATSANGVRMFFMDSRDLNVNSTSRFAVIFATNGVLSYYNGSGSPTLTLVGTIPVTTGSWNHIACVRRSNTIKFYVNGVQDTVSVADSVAKSGGSVSLGTSGYTTGETSYYFDGYIDEFAIFQYAKYSATFTPNSTEYNINQFVATAGTGGSSSFGSASSGPYFAANGGLGGSGGALTSTTSSGGASVTASSNIYDIVTYNTIRAVSSSIAGANNTITTGSSAYWIEKVAAQTIPGAGAAGGSSPAASYTTNYSGGLSNSGMSGLFHFENSDNSINTSNPLVVVSPATLSSADKKFGTNSLYNTSGYATVSNVSALFSKSTGDLTIEFWAKRTSTASCAYFGWLIPGPVGCLLSWDSPTSRLILLSQPITDFTININTWYHFAVVRISGVLYLYVNGVRSGNTMANTHDVTTINSFRIGGYYSNNPLPFTGYIDEFAIFPYAKYTTATFNVPTSAYNEIDLLTPNRTVSVTSSIGITINDFSNNTQTYDIRSGGGGGGGASAAVLTTDSADTLLHFNEASGSSTSSNSSNISKTVTMVSGRITDSGKFGGNCLYSKSNATAGQYTCVVSPGFTTAGDFTIEMWINLENYGSANSSGRACILFTTKGNGTTNSTGFMLMIGTNSKFLLLKDTSSGYVTSTTSFVANTWQHLAFVRKNGLVTLYVDGVADASITNLASAATQTYGTDIGVGCFPGSIAGDAAWNPNGRIDEFALFPYAKYSSNFNPSTFSEYPNGWISSNPGGLGGNGAWGSGGGGGGASTSNTGSLVGVRQGGNGGDGYVAIISYK